MKKNLIQAVGGIIVLATVFASCKKEVEMQPTSIQQEDRVEQNFSTSSEYGPWLKFENRKEYEAYVTTVKEILEKSSNSDSVLDLMDANNSFVSLRKYYNDSTAENRPANASEELAHGSLAAILNKNGIIQIDDTIIRMARHYVFMITDGDVSALQNCEQYLNESNIAEVVLPTNVLAAKISRSNAGLNSGLGYDNSYTEAKEYWVGSKTRYKLVAGYICYSFDFPLNLTEYYSSSKFEIGVRKSFGGWKWNSDWAVPLSLNCYNTFRVNFGRVSLIHGSGSIQEIHGKRVELRHYYWYDNQTRIIYYFQPIHMYSIHESVRKENTLNIQINKP